MGSLNVGRHDDLDGIFLVNAVSDGSLFHKTPIDNYDGLDYDGDGKCFPGKQPTTFEKKKGPGPECSSDCDGDNDSESSRDYSGDDDDNDTLSSSEASTIIADDSSSKNSIRGGSCDFRCSSNNGPTTKHQEDGIRQNVKRINANNKPSGNQLTSKCEEGVGDSNNTKISLDEESREDLGEFLDDEALINFFSDPTSTVLLQSKPTGVVLRDGNSTNNGDASNLVPSCPQKLAILSAPSYVGKKENIEKVSQLEGENEYLIGLSCDDNDEEQSSSKGHMTNVGHDSDLKHQGPKVQRGSENESHFLNDFGDDVGDILKLFSSNSRKSSFSNREKDTKAPSYPSSSRLPTRANSPMNGSTDSDLTPRCFDLPTDVDIAKKEGLKKEPGSAAQISQCRNLAKALCNPYKKGRNLKISPFHDKKDVKNIKQEILDQRDSFFTTEIVSQFGATNNEGIEGPITRTPTANASLVHLEDRFDVLHTNNQQRTPQNELDRLGIKHSHFKPSSCNNIVAEMREPIVHFLNPKTRPTDSRRAIPIKKVFSFPIHNFWKTCKFTSFNQLQSEMVQTLANSDDNVIVSAPTGSGKTALFEMAIARLFQSDLCGRHAQHGKQGGIGGVSSAKKVVYIAPSRALCEERQADWSKRLADIDPGIVCNTITGDATQGSSSYADIASAHVILTTPEKWDSITRKWNEYVVLLGCIKLLVLDEVHMVGEKDRGSCLESIVSRMKTIQRAATARKLTNVEISSSSFKNTTTSALKSNMRIVALSATLPNIGQIASFIESGEAFVFDISYRPVPLTTHVVGLGPIGKNRYLFDKSLDKHVNTILRRFSSGRPAIIFCHSKKETEQLSEELSKTWSIPLAANNCTLIEFASRASTSLLQRYLRRGIAYHHAGLDANDRKLVEDAFRSGSVSCLCATSTLAMGVNLPSHLVIIKGTSAYRGSGNGHQDIDTGTLLQMIGRAGRPGFDTKGTAVIMTDSHSKLRYENLSLGLKVVESNLLNKLTEVMNSEISQGVITCVEEAVHWLKGTFLYRRVRSNPLMYGVRGKGEAALNSFITEKCNQSIQELEKSQVISMNEDSNCVAPAAGCHIMSRHFVDFETMKSIIKLPHDSGPVQLLQMLSNCEKIQLPVRRHEKKLLNEAHKLIKYKLDGPASKIRIQTPAEKVFVLLQASICQHYFQDYTLRQEMSLVIEDASRLLSAVEEYAKEGSRHGPVAAQALLLRRSLAASLWGDDDGVLNQIIGVGQETTSKLINNGLSSFADIMQSQSDIIDKASNRPRPFGITLKDAVSRIMRCCLKISACIEENGDGKVLFVKLERRKSGMNLEETSGDRVVRYSLLLYTNRAGGLLHFADEISTESEIKVPCPKKFGQAYIRLISNLIGLDEQVTVINDPNEKCVFSLSPNVAKMSVTKYQKQSKMHDFHRETVKNVNDLRLCKKRKTSRKGDIIQSDTRKDTAENASMAKATGQDLGRKGVVTPSPHPPARAQRNSKSVQSVSRPHGAKNENACGKSGHHKLSISPKQNCERNNRALPSTSNARKVSEHRKVSTPWHEEKRQQKTFQGNAFACPKDNPFGIYSFDPNRIEASLDLASKRTKNCAETIFPNETGSDSVFSAIKTLHQKEPRFRTPSTRRKKSVASNRISSVGTLQQKAMELQHHHQEIAPRNFMPLGTSTYQNVTVDQIDGYSHGQNRCPSNNLTQYRKHLAGGMLQHWGAAHPGPLTQSPFIARSNFCSGPCIGNNISQTTRDTSMPTQQPQPFHHEFDFRRVPMASQYSQHHTRGRGHTQSINGPYVGQEYTCDYEVPHDYPFQGANMNPDYGMSNIMTQENHEVQSNHQEFRFERNEPPCQEVLIQNPGEPSGYDSLFEDGTFDDAFL